MGAIAKRLSTLKRKIHVFACFFKLNAIMLTCDPVDLLYSQIMNIKWPRFLRPTSLFVRGLLMILIPVLVLQIIVGTLIYQRYFQDVTRQLNAQVISEINFATARSTDPDQFIDILEELNLKVLDMPDLMANNFGWLDISGRLIAQNFRAAYGEGVFVDSRAWDGIQITVPFEQSSLNLMIDRSKLAPINPHQIMLNVMLFSIILVVLSIVFLRNQIRSLRKLSQAAKAFGRGEAVNYTPSGGDEIRSAGRSFLAMRNRISRQREHRNLMLAGVSHDLRTPLTRMRLSVEMLDSDEDRTTLSEDINAIEELADSFLSYASNDAPEDYKNIEIKPFIQMISNGYEKLTMGKIENINMRIKPVLFRRAIENILSNAERYADKVKISSSLKERHVVIIIDDNGPGIPIEQRESAVKPFTRLDPARNLDKNSHIGLGMAISVDAVRQHGGNLTLEESPMGGLRVEISIPTKAETA